MQFPVLHTTSRHSRRSLRPHFRRPVRSPNKEVIPVVNGQMQEPSRHSESSLFGFLKALPKRIRPKKLSSRIRQNSVLIEQLEAELRQLESSNPQKQQPAIEKLRARILQFKKANQALRGQLALHRKPADILRGGDRYSNRDLFRSGLFVAINGCCKEVSSHSPLDEGDHEALICALNVRFRVPTKLDLQQPFRRHAALVLRCKRAEEKAEACESDRRDSFLGKKPCSGKHRVSSRNTPELQLRGKPRKQLPEDVSDAEEIALSGLSVAERLRLDAEGPSELEPEGAELAATVCEAMAAGEETDSTRLLSGKKLRRALDEALRVEWETWWLKGISK